VEGTFEGAREALDRLERSLNALYVRSQIDNIISLRAHYRYAGVKTAEIAIVITGRYRANAVAYTIHRKSIRIYLIII